MTLSIVTSECAYLSHDWLALSGMIGSRMTRLVKLIIDRKCNCEQTKLVTEIKLITNMSDYDGVIETLVLFPHHIFK